MVVMQTLAGLLRFFEMQRTCTRFIVCQIPYMACTSRRSTNSYEQFFLNVYLHHHRRRWWRLSCRWRQHCNRSRRLRCSRRRWQWWRCRCLIITSRYARLFGFLHSQRSCTRFIVRQIPHMHLVQINRLVQANFFNVYPDHCYRCCWRCLSRRWRQHCSRSCHLKY